MKRIRILGCVGLILVLTILLGITTMATAAKASKEGWVKSGSTYYYYVNNRKFTGEVNFAKKSDNPVTGNTGVHYIKSGKLFTGLKNKIYYKDGLKGTGLYKQKYYVNGKLYTGQEQNGAYYKNGKLYTGTVGNKYYKNGYLKTGKYNGLMYLDGILADHKTYQGIFYVKGKPATGVVSLTGEQWSDFVWSDYNRITGDNNRYINRATNDYYFKNGKSISIYYKGKQYNYQDGWVHLSSTQKASNYIIYYDDGDTYENDAKDNSTIYTKPQVIPSRCEIKLLDRNGKIVTGRPGGYQKITVYIPHSKPETISVVVYGNKVVRSTVVQSMNYLAVNYIGVPADSTKDYHDGRVVYKTWFNDDYYDEILTIVKNDNGEAYRSQWFKLSCKYTGEVKYCYINDKGVAVKNKTKINGITYEFDKNGWLSVQPSGINSGNIKVASYY